MSEECQIHHKKLPCDECKAEQQKKQELYDPNPCGGNSTHCDGDCDNCSFSEDNYPDSADDEDDDWDYP